MTPRQIVAVGARLFAVWLMLNALANAYFALQIFGKSTSNDTIVLGVALTLLWAAAGVGLWYFPQAVSARLLPHDDPSASSQGSSPRTWFATGCALIGVWVIVSTLPPFAQSMMSIWHTGVPIELSVYFLVRVGLGVYLILGARGLGKIVRWAQDAGVERSEASQVRQ